MGHLGPLQLGGAHGAGRPERVAGGVSGGGPRPDGVLQMPLGQRDLRPEGPSMAPRVMGVNEKAPQLRGLRLLAQNTADIADAKWYTLRG